MRVACLDLLCDRVHVAESPLEPVVKSITGGYLVQTPDIHRLVRAEAQVLLVDTVGELTAFYAASDAAFVGGSLVPVGGHNLLEPAALGLPVITGPYTANGREIALRLIEAGGAVEVADGAALGELVKRLLADPALRERMGESARGFVEAHRGSLARLLVLIEPLIGGS